MAVSRTLNAKLAAISLTLLFALGVVYVALSLYTAKHHFEEAQQRLNEDLAEHLVTQKILFVDGDVNETALKDVFHMLMVINPNLELYLLDPAGAVLAYSAPPETVVRERVSLEPVERFLQSDALPILGDDPRDPDRQKIFSVAPVGDAGYIYIILASEEYDSAAHRWCSEATSCVSVHRALVVRVRLHRRSSGLVSFHLLTRRSESVSRGRWTASRRETSGTGALPKS